VNGIPIFMGIPLEYVPAGEIPVMGIPVDPPTAERIATGSPIAPTRIESDCLITQIQKYQAALPALYNRRNMYSLSKQHLFIIHTQLLRKLIISIKKVDQAKKTGFFRGYRHKLNLEKAQERYLKYQDYYEQVKKIDRQQKRKFPSLVSADAILKRDHKTLTTNFYQWLENEEKVKF
jgi:hypothetical protein